MKRLGIAVCLWVLFWGQLYGAVLTNYVTHDNSIIDYDGERDLNQGARTSFRLKSHQHHGIFKFDTSGLLHTNITAASIYFYKADFLADLQHATISTVQGDWEEGDQWGAVSEGGSCFNYAQYAADESNRVSWAWAGSKFPDVAYGNSFSLQDYSYITVGTNAVDIYYRWDINPDLVAANAVGASYGLVIFESSRIVSLNRMVYSHHQSNRRPFLVITCDGNTTGAGAITNATASAVGLDRGEVLLSWTIPTNAFAYYVQVSGPGFSGTEDVPRYLIPYAGSAGTTETMLVRDILQAGEEYTFTIEAVSRSGDVGNSNVVVVCAADVEEIPGCNIRVPDPYTSVSNGYTVGDLWMWVVPETEKVLPDGTFLTEDQITNTYKYGNPVFDGETITLYAAKNECVSFIVGLETTGASITNLHVALEGTNAIDGRLSRIGYINTASNYMPEIIYPSFTTLATDMDENAFSVQVVQQVLVDLLVPKDLVGGEYSLTVRVTGSGVDIAVPVNLHVWSFCMPDMPTFQLEMNDYGYPNYQATFNMLQICAHQDRAHVNLVPYGSTRTRMDMYLPGGGQMDESAYNDINAGDTTTHWDDFVTGFAPSFSGTLFTQDLWQGAALSGFYLTFHESWPLKYDVYYSPGGMDALTAFTNHPEYRQTFANLLSNFVALAHSYQWTNAGYQVYLNNKQHPWDYDEPFDFWDFRALNYYAQLYDEGISNSTGGVDIQFRADISRPQYQRGMLDGMLDLNVVGRAFFTYARIVMEEANRNGTEVWNYGTAADVYRSNHNQQGWPMFTYAFGGNGVLPWSTVKSQSDRNYLGGVTTGDYQKRALYIIGSDSQNPVVYSTLRMKAYRRAQQDLEYLRMAGEHLGLTDGQLSRMVLDVIGDAATIDINNNYVEDAGTILFEGLSEADFFVLRHKAALMLEDRYKPFMEPGGVGATSIVWRLDNLYLNSTCYVQRSEHLIAGTWVDVTNMTISSLMTNWPEMLDTTTSNRNFRFLLQR